MSFTIDDVARTTSRCIRILRRRTFLVLRNWRYQGRVRFYGLFRIERERESGLIKFWNSTFITTNDLLKNGEFLCELFGRGHNCFGTMRHGYVLDVREDHLKWRRLNQRGHTVESVGEMVDWDRWELENQGDSN